MENRLPQKIVLRIVNSLLVLALLSYVLLCYSAYPHITQISPALTQESYFLVCATIICLLLLFKEFFGWKEVIPELSNIVRQGVLNDSKAYQYMFNKLGAFLLPMGLAALMFMYTLFCALEPQVTFFDGLLFIVLAFILISVVLTIAVKAMMTYQVKSRWLLRGHLLFALLFYLALLEIAEYLLGFTADLTFQSFIIDVIALLGSGLIIVGGCILGIGLFWYVANRMFHFNGDVTHISLTSILHDNIVKSQHYFLLQFGNMNANLFLLFLPLYFHCLMNFDTQTILVLFTLTLGLPFLLKASELLIGLKQEFFFVLLKNVISAIVGVIFVSHMIYLLAYMGLYQLKSWLIEFNWDASDGIFPNFLFYFVDKPVELNFLLAYIEGVLLSIVSLSILIWLYAIFVRKDPYRILWLLLTTSLFFGTVWYDNYVSAENLQSLTSWTLSPQIILYTAIPILVHFIINVIAGPYRINTKCGVCRFKAPKLAHYCPCCGSVLHLSKPTKHRLLKEFNKQLEKQSDSELDEKQRRSLDYKLAAIRRAIGHLGVLKEVIKIDTAKRNKAISKRAKQ